MRLRNLHQQLSRNLVTNRLLSHFDIFCIVKLIIYATLIQKNIYLMSTDSCCLSDRAHCTFMHQRVLVEYLYLCSQNTMTTLIVLLYYCTIQGGPKQWHPVGAWISSLVRWIIFAIFTHVSFSFFSSVDVNRNNKFCFMWINCNFVTMVELPTTNVVRPTIWDSETIMKLFSDRWAHLKLYIIKSKMLKLLKQYRYLAYCS